MLKFIIIVMTVAAVLSSAQVIDGAFDETCPISNGNDCEPSTVDADTIKWLVEHKTIDYSKLNGKFKPSNPMIDDFVKQAEKKASKTTAVLGFVEVTKFKAVSYIHGGAEEDGAYYLVKVDIGKENIHLDIFRWNDGRSSLLYISRGNSRDTYNVKNS